MYLDSITAHVQFSQMLMCLEKESHMLYKSLIFSPLLMFEQLLMNAKISWAARVLPLLCTHEETFCKHSEDVHETPDGTEFRFREKVNELLVQYAEKAVDFPVLIVLSDQPGG